MATSNRTADVLLRYSVDTASVNRVRTSFVTLENGLDDLRAELTGVGTSAQRGVTALRQQFDRGEASIASMSSEVDELRRELLALDDVKVSPSVSVARQGNGLETVDRLGTIGSQIAGGFGNSALGNVTGLVGDVAGSFATLGLAGGAAALAVGGVSLALGELQRVSDAANEATRLRLEGERAGEAQAADPVAARVARINDIIALIAAEEASIAERQAEIDQRRNAAAAQFGVSANDVIVFGLEPLQKSIDDSTASIAGLSAEFIQLQEDLSPELLRDINNASAGVKLLKDAFTPFVGAVVEAAQGAADTAQRLTSTGQVVTSILGTVGDEISKLAERAQAAADQLRTDKASAYLGAITQTVTAQEALTKAQAAYADAVDASQVRIADIGRKLQEDLAEAETDRQRELADAVAKAGDDRVRVEEESAQERLRIQARFARSFSEAVADRDALAAKRAEEQRDDELSQLTERGKEQTRAIDKALAQQQKLIETRYQQQVATLNAAAQAAVRTEQQGAQARLQALQQGIQAAQVALINAQQSEYLIRANYYNQAVSQAQVWANLMRLYTSYGFALPGGSGGSIGGPVRPTPLATGGPAFAGRPYLVGEQGPELFIPAQSGRIIPNGSAFTINVQGAQMDTIRVTSRQQALNAFDGILRQMGVA